MTPDAPGLQYADPLAPATMRMSEALGNAGAEGKTLNFTEADRSRVFGPNRGGVGFSGLQHYSLPHQQANTVWGFGKKSVAEKKIRQNDPENTLFTTFVGSPTQHKSNSVVIGDAIKEFQKSVKKGDVPREQIMLMNKRLNESTDDKTGAKVFEEGFDLTDPSALNVANTFARRAAVGDVMLGVGVKGPMVRLEFKKEFPNTKFVDASNIENILKRETDPDLVDAGTYDVGNRLFVMDGKIIERPDLNEAFPIQVTGSDLGMKYQLVPPDKAMRDFYKAREGRKNKHGDPSPVSYYDLARAEPSQLVDEDYLTFLQKEGYAKGGEVDGDQELKAMIADHLESQRDDPELRSMIEGYMAGGEVGMAGGGKMVKKAFKKLFNDDVLPAAEREANLAKMMADSKVKDRLYHGTDKDFSEFKFNPKKSMGTWLTNRPKLASAYSEVSARGGDNSVVYPLYAQIKNPASEKDFMDARDIAQAQSGTGGWHDHTIRHKQLLLDKGFDGVKLKDGTYIAFEPTQIKSAIGNRGTYDTNEADITKAHGGLAMADGGKIVKGAVKGFKKLFAEPATESKIIQPPSIIIPSKLTELRKTVQKEKGDYGSRRLERAADEIPNLERLYKEQALREAFLGDNAKALMTMNPAKFEKYSEPLNPGFTDAASTRFTTSGKRLTYPEYMEDYLPNVGAFNDVPFLEINKAKQGSPMLPFISGHEGRHRNRVMADRGDEAGLVQLLPRYELREPFPRRSQEEYIEALKKELLITNNKVRPEEIFEGFHKTNIKRPSKTFSVTIEFPSAIAFIVITKGCKSVGKPG